MEVRRLKTARSGFDPRSVSPSLGVHYGRSERDGVEINEDEIRRFVLDKLHTTRLKDPHDYVTKQDLLDAQGILGLQPNVLDRNVKYLEEKGLIDVQWYSGADFMAQINAFGVDALERRADVPFQSAGSATVLERELDSLLAERMPLLRDELAITREHLANADKPIDFQAVALACRNHFIDFAEAIYRPEFLPKGEEPPARNQVKRRIALFMRAVNAGETERTFVGTTIAQFDALVDLIQKQIHLKSATRAYSAACLAGLEAALLLILRKSP